MTISRRTFVIHNAAIASVLGTLASVRTAHAQASLVQESDPQAVALGYKADASKVDTKKFPNYAASQSCSGCALFQGKPTDSTSACAVFNNKHVASKGWCGAWSKRG
jgi:hypothetical protein